jgi:hypothetical protein
LDDAKTIIERQGRIASGRANLDTWWQDIALRVLPLAAQFTTTSEQGEKRTERLFTGKPVTDNERFAAVMDELLTPRTQKWHVLAPEDEEIEDDQQVASYMERLNKLLFTMRYRPKADFASQNHQGFLSIGAFGNSCLFVDEAIGEGPRYRQWFLKECYWSENQHGQIDTLYRRYLMTAGNAARKAREEGWDIPSKVSEKAAKDPYCTFEFIRAIVPNEERVMSRLDHVGMAFKCFDIAVEEKHMCKVGGFRTWPCGTGRYMLAPNESYGRSPAMAAWPGILTLNEQKKTVLRAGQKEVDPPILLAEDGALEPFNQRPGAANYGMLSADGSMLAQPLKTGANVPLGIELMALEGQEIEEAFLVSIFKILSEHPQMTATQVLEITQQKATLLAPMMGRQQSGYLGPIIEREIDILSRDSRFAWIEEEMPESLRSVGGAYKIEYRSPLARAMRAQDGVAIMRTLEVLPVAAQADPYALLVMDVPGSMRELAEINGVPAKLIRDTKMVAAMKQQAREAEELEAAVDAAPQLSQAALNAAKAEQLRTGT